MKDLGFNEFGELANGGDEESLNTGGSMELTSVNKSGPSMDAQDPDGEEEAENTEIAI